MKLLHLVLLVFIAPVALTAQLINNGGSIFIEAGSSVNWKSSIENNSLNSNMGFLEIKGDGVLQLDGNLMNNATFQMDMSSTLVFSGDISSSILSGNAIFSNVSIDKIDNDIILLDEMSVSGELNFAGDNNKVILNDNNLILTSDATVTSADESKYIVADDLGIVSKELGVASGFVYHIGTAEGLYTPINANVTSANFPISLDINTVSMKHPNIPIESSDFINRYWNVDASDDANLEATLTGTYHSTDIQSGSTISNIKGTFYNSADWSYQNSTNSGTDVIGDISSSGDFTGTNAFGRASLKAFLDGAFSGGTMSTTLNSSDLLPTTSPYGDGATVAAGFFAANTDIVDWVYLESRNTTTPAIVEGTGSAFIKSDGTIVALDGTSNPFIKNAVGTGYVVIKHRNHLPVCTGSSIGLDGIAILQDFTDIGYASYGSNGLRNNGGTMTMWAGDLNDDDEVVYAGVGSDITPISVDVFSNPANTTFSASFPFAGYNNSDANLNGETVYIGTGSDITPISIGVFSNPANTTFSASFPITAQIPE